MTTVYVCGSNKHSQLGLPTKSPEGTVSRFEPLSYFAEKNVALRDVATGANLTVFIDTSGKLYACGSETRRAPHPVAKLRGTVVVQASVGTDSVYAITDEGGLVRWTVTASSLFRLGSNDVARFRVKERFVGVSCGALFAVAWTASGVAFGIGMNAYHQLGDYSHGEDYVATAPQPITLPCNVRYVVCGGCHAVAMLVSGDVVAWGRNDFGQLGLGHTRPVTQPTPLNFRSPKPIVEIVCGDYHTLLRDSDGVVTAFGSNEQNQLGIESTAADGEPRTVRLPPAVAIAAGGGYGNAHSVAVTANGHVYGWGSNAQGQLGRLEATPVATPTRLDLAGTSEASVPRCGWLYTIVFTPHTSDTVMREYEPVTLGTLVPDICGVIATYLARRDLLAMSLVCSAWDEFVRDDDHWRQLYLRRFPATHALERPHGEPDLGFKAEIARLMRAKFRLISNYTAPSKVNSEESILQKIAGMFRTKRKADRRLLMVGLDAAGKTTILYKLKLGDVTTTIPTIGFNVETVEYKNITLTAWDVGGPDKIRPLWRHYYQKTDVIVFVVDSNDRDRLCERSSGFSNSCGTAKYELDFMLQEEHLRDAALMVIANKQDLPRAMGVETVADYLQLHSIRNRRVAIQGVCAVTGEGLYEAFEWISQSVEGH